MTNGLSVLASIAVVSQIPTEDKNTFNVSACLSKHRGWTPKSNRKKIHQSQQALDLDIQIRLSVAASTAFGRHLSVHRPNAIQKRLMWGVPHTPVLFYKGV